jgi:hypothetical protein
VPHESTLQGIRQNLCILLVEFVEQTVLDTASKPSSEPASKTSLLSLTAEERVTMKRIRSRLLACEKGSSHLHAVGSKSEGSHDSARVSNSTCGDNGELYGIDDLRH